MKVEYKGGYDFSDGVQIEKETIDEWIEEILDYLIESKKKYRVIRCGNSMVIGIRHKKEIEIFEVTSGYTKHLYKIKRDK